MMATNRMRMKVMMTTAMMLTMRPMLLELLGEGVEVGSGEVPGEGGGRESRERKSGGREGGREGREGGKGEKERRKEGRENDTRHKHAW